MCDEMKEIERAAAQLLYKTAAGRQAAWRLDKFADMYAEGLTAEDRMVVEMMLRWLAAGEKTRVQRVCWLVNTCCEEGFA